MRRWEWIMAGTIACTGAAAMAGAQNRLPSQCRQEIVKLCGTDRSQIRSCLMEKRDKLSADCKSALKQRMQQKMGATPTGTTPTGRTPAEELHYGSDKLQSLDLYALKTDRPAPLVLFVHGGGWSRGDKAVGVEKHKISHYHSQGYHFASANYRLVPDVTVEQQAADLADAIAKLIAQSPELNIDPRKIVLMGHSAGAHLVALVATDPQYLRNAGLHPRDIAGVICNDGVYYLPTRVNAPNPAAIKDRYADAFGDDPARQAQLSPRQHTQTENAQHFLILHSDRDAGEQQGRDFAAALQQGGSHAQVHGFAGKGMRGHLEINHNMGDPEYPATRVVDAWLEKLFG